MSTGLHVPEARVGLLVSAFAIASALAAIPVTALLRGLPRRPVLGTVGAARRTAFPPERREEGGIPGRVALLPRA